MTRKTRGPVLIGLAGRARSGKNEAAKALTSQGYREDAFATRIRSFLYALDPTIDDANTLAGVVDYLGWDKAKTIYPEVRRLMQRCGTEAGRDVLGDNVWIDPVLRAFCGQSVDTVVTDVRYANESNAVRAVGGIVVLIHRPGLELLTDDAGNSHRSETSLDDYAFDATITNDGTVEQLHRCVRLLADRLRYEGTVAAA